MRRLKTKKNRVLLRFDDDHNLDGIQCAKKFCLLTFRNFGKLFGGGVAKSGLCKQRSAVTAFSFYIFKNGSWGWSRGPHVFYFESGPS